MSDYALKTDRGKSWRLLQLVTFVHVVHHIHFGYGYVFVPLMLGFFREYRDVYAHTRGGARARRFVRPKYFHDCSWTGAY